MFFRTIGRPALARVIDPTHDVIIIVLLADLGQVRGKRATHLGVLFTDRVTGETATRLKQSLAVILVSLLLRGNFAIETVLPKVRRYGFQVLRSLFAVFSETPEGGHLRTRTKSLRVLQPNRNPFLAQLEAHVLEIRTNFFLVLLQVTGLKIQFVNPRGQLTVGDPQRIGMGQEALHFSSIVAGVAAGFSVQPRLAIVSGNLILELADRLARIGQGVTLAIECLHAMTTDTATLIEEILAQIQSVRALRHAVVRMTHLATGLSVLFMKQRMQPEWILSVSFNCAGGGAAITAVASGATKSLRIVYLQQLFARMGDKCLGQLVGV